MLLSCSAIQLRKSPNNACSTRRSMRAASSSASTPSPLMSSLLRLIGLTLGLAVFCFPSLATEREHRTAPDVRKALDALVSWTVPAALQRYNRIQVTPSFAVQGSGAGSLEEELAGQPFACTQQLKGLPQDTVAAQKAFGSFMDSFERTANAGISAGEMKERLRLLEHAIQAGSWRARFSDLLWRMKTDSRDPVAAQQMSKELLDMVDQHNPAAVYIADAWIYAGEFDQTAHRTLIRLGVKLGNPQVISQMGHRLATGTLQHRARGIAMLRCAADQGDPDAYYSLGLVASQEGRMFDAYRLFEQGGNLGCDSCFGRLEELALRQPGFLWGRDTTVGAVPAVKSLQDFYEGQFFWKLTKLPELRRQAPAFLQLRLTDDDIVGLAEGSRARAGLDFQPR